MQSSDGQDTLEVIGDLPVCDVGAPIPAVVAVEGRLFLAYVVSAPDPDWDGSYATVASPQTSDLPIAVVEFKDPVAHMFGSIPDEETIRGHPLAGAGLEAYELFEVRRSSWIRRLEHIHSSSPGHWPERLIGQRHFILGLHDSTFECVARSFEFRVERGSISSVLQTMSRMAVA